MRGSSWRSNWRAGWFWGRYLGWESNGLNLAGQVTRLFSDSASLLWSGVNSKTLKRDVINGKSSYIVEGIKKNKLLISSFKYSYFLTWNNFSVHKNVIDLNEIAEGLRQECLEKIRVTEYADPWKTVKLVNSGCSQKYRIISGHLFFCVTGGQIAAKGPFRWLPGCFYWIAGRGTATRCFLVTFTSFMYGRVC